jgi:trigger factor
MLDKLSEQHKVWAQTDGVSKSGSKVDIDFDGFVDGVAFEGGKAEHYELVLGEGSMIPGFEEGIEGLKSGDEKDISVTFPGDYNQADLAGKDAIFKIKLHKVFEGSLPEVNDELAEKFGVKEGGVEKFKSDIRNNMERELERQTTQVNKEKAFDLFLEKNPVDLPKALVDKEVEHLRKDMLQRVFGNQPVDASKLPQLPASMFDIQAKRRVHLGLVFSEFVKVHELKPTPEKVDVFLEKMASSYEKPEEVIDWYRGNQERMGEIEAAVLEEIAVEKMTENLKITEEKMDYNSVMNPPKPETQDNENKAEN